MAYPRFSQIYGDTITRIGQVDGSAVQKYTEPQVKLGVNRIFNYLWDKRKWDHLWAWEIKTLDGTTGKFTAAFTTVRMPEDIGDIYISGQNTAVPYSSRTEHLAVTGSRPYYRTMLPWDDADAETKFIKLWPITATGDVEVHVGHRPDVFEGDDDIIPMDYDLMVDGATWWILEDDGSNPASVDKARLVFDQKYQNVVARLNAQPIGFGGGRRDNNVVIVS